MATPKIVADFESQLSTAIAVGGTTFSLSSATDDDGVALPTGLYYFTVDNGSTNKEYLAGTLTGTSVTGVVSVSRQGVETSGAVRKHRVGASVILTDFNTYKTYMDGIALVSAPDASISAKGVVEMATQAEVDAGTSVGGTLARLVVGADTLRSGNYNDYVVDTGTANAYAIAPSPAITAYAAGQVFTFKAVNANTGGSTLNVNGLGLKTIKKKGTVAAAAGDIPANGIVVVVYDGTDFQLVSAGVAQDTQTFTADGTWTKPAGAVAVDVYAIGGGAGGGGGSGTATNETGGGGGSAGSYLHVKLLASSLASTVAVTVGAGGTGGAGTATGTGTVGAVGGNSTFGAHLTALGGLGGRPGDQGGVAAPAVSSRAQIEGAYASTVATTATGNGAASGNPGGTAVAANALVPTGGGGGGNAGAAGGAGGAIATVQTVAGGTAGAAGVAGGNGNQAVSFPIVGTGGGGGGGASGTGGNGGAGALYGSGGGGGGASADGTGGTGGAGAAGIVVVITTF